MNLIELHNRIYAELVLANKYISKATEVAQKHSDIDNFTLYKPLNSFKKELEALQQLIKIKNKNIKEKESK